jgi:hypothetical protein
MRIGTWNVEYADEVKLDVLRNVLARNIADIWVLTETHDDLVPPNCSNVAHSEPRPKNWWRIRPGSRWVSIWSKYPIIKNLVPLSSDNQRTVTALIDLGERKTLLVYGTVLPWKDDRKIPGWFEHERVITLQGKEWMELRKAYPDTPLCIAGDLNTDMADGRRYGSKAGIAALRKAFSNAGVFCSTDPDSFPAALLPILPIDHIALPVEWKNITSVVSAWPADRACLSDHSGMVVEVDLR